MKCDYTVSTTLIREHPFENTQYSHWLQKTSKTLENIIPCLSSC